MAKRKRISFPALRIVQPLGIFYVGVISSKDLVEISYADVREIETDLDKYLGIQRRLHPKRVKELQQYVHSIDATFPTSVILAINGDCADWDEEKLKITLQETDEIPYNEIAKILDGQHRIEGLKNYQENDFEVNVSIFIDADIAEQANIFATVNLAQTKVNKSLVYDLYDYSKSRSPQKTCHDVAVALDQHQKSPFYHRIKRLGLATSGRDNSRETLTQATVVEALMKLISVNAMEDRQILLKGKRLKRANREDLKKTPFRNLFIDGQDKIIIKLLFDYFSAVKDKWPKAWEGKEKGQILPKTNGFRALMRYLKVIYTDMCETWGWSSDGKITEEDFKEILSEFNLTDADFNTNNFQPGSSGEGALYRRLIESIE